MGRVEMPQRGSALPYWDVLSFSKSTGAPTRPTRPATFRSSRRSVPGLTRRSMRRRDFITLLGTALIGLPIGTHAQESKVFKLGYLQGGLPSDPIEANLRRQFLLGMRDLGYVEGRHFKMEDRNAEGHLASYGTSRTDLWRRSESYVDKIMRGANPGDLPV